MAEAALASPSEARNPGLKEQTKGSGLCGSKARSRHHAQWSTQGGGAWCRRSRR